MEKIKKICKICNEKIGEMSPHVNCYSIIENALKLDNIPGFKKIEVMSDKYIDNVCRSYGANDYSEKGISTYKKSRLKSGRSGKTNSNTDQLDTLEKKLYGSKKSTLKIDISKRDLTEIEVLVKRIENIESLLGNENFLAKVDNKVIESKTEELNKLKTQLKKL